MQIFDSIILGGGASGCICALRASQKSKQILMIDQSPLPGKKLLATGNGRCNLSNERIFPSKNFFNQDIDSYLKVFDNNKLIAYFQELGLITYADEEGRIYPISNSAKSVVDVLNNELSKQKSLKIMLNTSILNLSVDKNLYIVETDKGKFASKNVVIATGGNSLNYLKNNFSLDFTPLVPSLTSLKTDIPKNMAGIRISPVKIAIPSENFSEIGEILFKENGISGIVVFNASANLARDNHFSGAITLDLLPKISEKELVALLTKRKSLALPINKFFDGIFLPQVGYFILNRCKIDENRTSNMLTNEEISLLAKNIKNVQLKIKGHFDNNQVYSGGIKLSSLTENLESRAYKRMYFCGEACDVDGVCGGYNLQWALTSGYIVGENLK